MLFEEPSPACRVRSGVEGQKGQMRARISMFVLGSPHSQLYEFDHNNMKKLKFVHLPMSLDTPNAKGLCTGRW
jgi:hypothetical protein